MSEIQFVEVDPKALEREIIDSYERTYRQTLYPGDERRIFLMQLMPIIAGLKNDINESAKQNLLRYATGEKLDALGERFKTPRLEAKQAITTLRFSLSVAQLSDTLIPQGTRVTPDGQLYFATLQPLVISAGEIEGDIQAESLEGGEKYNGFVEGQIKNLVDPTPYVSNVVNIDTSSGGSDVEPDDDGVNIWSAYRERIRQAPESYSTAGPEGGYIYWAKTANADIIDVSVSSPSPNVIRVVVLMKDGDLPSQSVLDSVTDTVTPKDIRPMGDNVGVYAPTEDFYDITLTYYISKERKTEEGAIIDNIENSGGAIDQYTAWQRGKLGRAINSDYLRDLMLRAGAFRIEITSPVYTEVDIEHVAKSGVITINYGGLI